jgi:hypothetical protein
MDRFWAAELAKQACSWAVKILAIGDAVGAHESVSGTNRTSSDVRYSVAIGGKPDMAQTAQFGRASVVRSSHLSGKAVINTTDDQSQTSTRRYTQP